MNNGTWKLTFNNDTGETLEGTLTAQWTENQPPTLPEGWQPLTFSYQARTKIDGVPANHFLQTARQLLQAYLAKAVLHRTLIETLEDQLNVDQNNSDAP